VAGNWVGRTVTANTTWTAANSPYLIAQTVVVSPSVTLTIQPGVVVKFGGNTGLTVNGTLSAVGTTSQHIGFTANSAATTSGQWTSVTLGTGAAASSLNYCDVSYGGTGSLYLLSNATVQNTTVTTTGYAIRIVDASPTLTGLTITGSGSRGVSIEGTAAPTLTQCNFAGNYTYDIYVSHSGTTPPNTSPVVHQCNFTGTSAWRVYVGGSYATPLGALNFENNWWGTTDTAAINGAINDGYDGSAVPDVDYLPFLGSAGGAPVAGNWVGRIVSASTTWTAASSPYLVAQTVTVNAGVTLTIQPGVVVKFGGGTGLTVNGTLSAVGTTSQHIGFTANSAATTSGQWTSVTLGTGAAASSLNYCDVSYGGTGSLYLLSNATVQNTTVTTAGYAIRIVDASPTLTGLTITGSGSRGVSIEGTAAPTLTQCNFAGNYTYDIYVSHSGTTPPNTSPVVHQCNFTGTSAWRVYVGGSYATPLGALNFENNWWGTTDTAAINGAINDGYDGSAVPDVDYLPFLGSAGGAPVAGNWWGARDREHHLDRRQQPVPDRADGRGQPKCDADDPTRGGGEVRRRHGPDREWDALRGWGPPASTSLSRPTAP
jgi:hypothetical protein